MRYLPVIIVALALICIQALIGGVRLVFSLPAYILLAVGALSAVAFTRQLKRPPSACLSTALLLAGWVVARALASPVEYLARTDLLMILAAVLVYLLTVACFTSSKSRVTLISILLFFALAHVVIGAIQFKQNDNFMLIPGIMRPDIYGWRASGFYICPNHLAGLLEMIGLVAFSLACWGDLRAGGRVLSGYCALMCLGGLALTGSRGGYLSVILGLVAFAILCLWAVQMMRRGGFWLTFVAVALSGIVIVGGAFYVMSRSDFINDRLTRIYDPTNMRLFMWQAALKQYHLQPITGTGSGTYLFYGRQFRSPKVQSDPIHVHDDYLELLAEYGVVGAILCGIFLFVHLFSGLAGVRKIISNQMRPGEPGSNYDLALTIGALSAVAALLLHSVFDFNLHIPANALFVAFLFGILASPVTNDAPQSAPVVKTAAWSRWLIAAVALILLGLSLRLLPGEIYAERARVAFRDGHYPETLALAQRGLAWEKKNPFLYGYLGDAKHFLTMNLRDVASARALHEEAVAAYSAGLRLFPEDTGLLLKKAQALDLLDRFGEAEEIFQHLFRSDPVFGNVYAYYGLHWQLQRRLGAAEHCFRIAMQLEETRIAPNELKNIERMKADPVGQALVSALPGPELDLPAERFLPRP